MLPPWKERLTYERKNHRHGGSDRRTKDGKEKKPAAPKKVADTGGFCVYLGPTMMGVIQRGTIYRGGRKEVLDSLAPVIEQHPLIASLVVSDETLPADRIKVKTPGNLLYVNYHKLAKGMK